MRISDWSSDVCSSDLLHKVAQQRFVVKNELPHLAETEHFQHLRLALFERLARAELRDRLVERLFRRLTRDAEPLLDPFVWHDPEVCAPGLFQVISGQFG